MPLIVASTARSIDPGGGAVDVWRVIEEYGRVQGRFEACPIPPPNLAPDDARGRRLRRLVRSRRQHPHPLIPAPMGCLSETRSHSPRRRVPPGGNPVSSDRHGYQVIEIQRDNGCAAAGGAPYDLRPVLAPPKKCRAHCRVRGLNNRVRRPVRGAIAWVLAPL